MRPRNQRSCTLRPEYRPLQGDEVWNGNVVSAYIFRTPLSEYGKHIWLPQQANLTGKGKSYIVGPSLLDSVSLGR